MIEKIIKVLLEYNRSLTARELSNILRIEKSTINSVLYQFNGTLLMMNNNYEWSIISQKDYDTISDEDYFDDFKSNCVEIKDYIVEVFNGDSDCFKVSSIYYDANDKLKNLVIELDVYLICSILKTSHKFTVLLNEENVSNVLSNLEDVLSYRYSSSSILNFYTTKFVILNEFITNFLKSIIYYDDKYETRKSYIILSKLEMTLENYIKSLLNKDDFMEERIKSQIITLKKFINTFYDYTEGNINTIYMCESCGDIVDRFSGDWLEGDFYCDDCYEEHKEDIFIQEASELEIDEDIDIDNETDEYSDDEDIIDEQPLKQVIIEDCTTCLFSKNKTCKKAYLNQICLDYIYFKN